MFPSGAPPAPSWPVAWSLPSGTPWFGCNPSHRGANTGSRQSGAGTAFRFPFVRHRSPVMMMLTWWVRCCFGNGPYSLQGRETPAVPVVSRKASIVGSGRPHTGRGTRGRPSKPQYLTRRVARVATAALIERVVVGVSLVVRAPQTQRAGWNESTENTAGVTHDLL